MTGEIERIAAWVQHKADRWKAKSEDQSSTFVARLHDHWMHQQTEALALDLKSGKWAEQLAAYERAHLEQHHAKD